MPFFSLWTCFDICVLYDEQFCLITCHNFEHPFFLSSHVTRIFTNMAQVYIQFFSSVLGSTSSLE